MTVDLTTTYLGLTLKNPLVASASPLTGSVESLRRLEEAGAAAAVLPSLFEEQIEHEEMQVARLYEFGAESFAESLSYFPQLQDYNLGPGEYLRSVEAAKRAVSMPIIGSLNGSSEGGWTHYARAIQDAGADALELNVYFVPSSPLLTAADVEQRYVDLVTAVRQSVSIPLAVKIGPNFSALPNFAARLIAHGADGLVLFNRYLEADIDLATLQFKPDLVLSNRHESRTAMRWIAILRDSLPRASLAATGGVHRMQGLVKVLLAGADVAMLASVLIKMGPGYLTPLLEQTRRWLVENEYQSIAQLKGSMSMSHCPDPSALVRTNYMKTLMNYAVPLHWPRAR